MPLHDFRCLKCGLFQKLQTLEGLKDLELCPICGGPSEKTFVTFHQGSGGVRVFRPRWFEHIAPEPLYIESREQLRKECERNNAKSVYLEDSYNK